MITPAIEVVKPATFAEVLHLGFRTELDFIEADARDMGESEFTDAEWDAMAEEAALQELAETGRFWM